MNYFKPCNFLVKYLGKQLSYEVAINFFFFFYLHCIFCITVINLCSIAIPAYLKVGFTQEYASELPRNFLKPFCSLSKLDIPSNFESNDMPSKGGGFCLSNRAFMSSNVAYKVWVPLNSYSISLLAASRSTIFVSTESYTILFWSHFSNCGHVLLGILQFISIF